MLSEQIRNILKKNSNRKEEIQPVSRGLGDTIEKFANTTGLNKITEAYSQVTKKDCGCNKRRDLLNQLVPYKQE